jgi:BMFP domain-containing protein YqiC
LLQTSKCVQEEELGVLRSTLSAMRTENDTLNAHVANLSAERDHLSGQLSSTVDKVEYSNSFTKWLSFFMRLT